MPLKREASNLINEMSRIADHRSDMAASATGTTYMLRTSTKALIENSRKLLKETAELLEDYKPTKR